MSYVRCGSAGVTKPELIQTEQGIRSTIVVFGSAPSNRRAPDRPSKQPMAELKMAPQDQARQQRVRVAERRLALAPTTTLHASSATWCLPPVKSTDNATT